MKKCVIASLRNESAEASCTAIAAERIRQNTRTQDVGNYVENILPLDVAPLAPLGVVNNPSSHSSRIAPTLRYKTRPDLRTFAGFLTLISFVILGGALGDFFQMAQFFPSAARRIANSEIRSKHGHW